MISADFYRRSSYDTEEIVDQISNSCRAFQQQQDESSDERLASCQSSRLHVFQSIMDNLSIFTDPVVTCPYDKYHRVAMSKIQGHIVKCEKNYPPGYKLTCPYNATHRLFDHELQDHINTCRQRRPLDPDETYQRVRNHGSQMSEFMAKSIIESNLDHGECWDDELQPDCNSLSNESRDINPQSSSRSVDDPNTALRRPRGYSEAMMMGGDSDVAEISDMESVVSVMGMGRGRMNPSQIQLYRNRLGFGRGKPMTKN